MRSPNFQQGWASARFPLGLHRRRAVLPYENFDGSKDPKNEVFEFRIVSRGVYA